MHAESDGSLRRRPRRHSSTGCGPSCASARRAEREAGPTRIVVERQLAAVLDRLGDRISGCVVAYEPVWAIGTGKNASPGEAQAVHALLRSNVA